MEYNTSRTPLIIPEYGRNIQNMVLHAISIADREERNKAAKTIVEVMAQLNPQPKDKVDLQQKFWDHLFIISDFKLDVDSPYPMPDSDLKSFKPEKPSYGNTDKVKYKYYGRNLPALINKAVEMEDGDNKQAFVQALANIMKKSYVTWNRTSVDDHTIFEHLKVLSDNKLQLSENLVLDKANFNLNQNTNSFAAKKKKRKKGFKPRKNKFNN
jgi:hypothetical protein